MAGVSSFISKVYENEAIIDIPSCLYELFE